MFRVYPDAPSRLFFRVLVFQTIKNMRAHIRNRPSCPVSSGRFTKGIVSSWRRQSYLNGRWKTHPELGEILLAKGWLGSELLSHEAGHAALAWARRRRVYLTQNKAESIHVSDQEERFCYALGRIMRGLVYGLHEKGVLSG